MQCISSTVLTFKDIMNNVSKSHKKSKFLNKQQSKSKFSCRVRVELQCSALLCCFHNNAISCVDDRMPCITFLSLLMAWVMGRHLTI